MITNYGWTGFVKGMANAQPLPFIPTRNGKSSKTPYIVGTVTEVTNQDTGEILVFSQGTSFSTIRAIPLFSFIKSIPVAGEAVILIKNDLQSSIVNNSVYYLTSLNIWNNPSLNSIEQSPQISDPNNKNYFSPSKIQNIIPLLPLPGDVIFEGRFGNNIRLGNTNPNFANKWSESGEKGDPITIISNGQASENPTNVENISEDLSSIYLTSYQKIANFSLANENFNSYKKTPEKSSEYTQPQIILNSSRIILNANNANSDNLNTGDVLISGEKSIGLSSNESINIESTETIIDGKVLLGSKDAKESALLGDTTQELLIQLTTEVRNLSLALQTVPFAVGPVASISTPILENILSGMSKIKSNTVKLK
jgi:hypothetical protein